jgi:uncharacterized protein YdaU (DUF1376 family)
MHLALVDHGVYTLMMDAYYALNGDLPLHLSELNRLCRAHTKIERESVLKIAQEYFPTNGDGVRHNARADKELAIALPAILRMREGGQKTAKKRWGKT